MSNRRPNFRWLPHCSSFLLGATTAFCYHQLRHTRSSPQDETLLVLPPRARLLATPTGVPSIAAAPQPTIKIPAPKVLDTPPLAKRKAAEKSNAGPGPSENPPLPDLHRAASAPVEFGQAPASTSTDTPYPDPSTFLLPEPAPSAGAPAQAPSRAPEAPRPGARLAAAIPKAAIPKAGTRAPQDRPQDRPQSGAQKSGAQTGGVETHSESSASAVAAAVTRPGGPAAAPATTPPISSDAAAGTAGVAVPSAGTDSAGANPSAGASASSPASSPAPEAFPDISASGPPTAASSGPDAAAPPASTSGAAVPDGAAASHAEAEAATNTPSPAQVLADNSLAPSGASTLPERAEAGVSSRTSTSENNALSPAPPEAQLPLPSVSMPLAGVNASTLNGIATEAGTTKLGPEPLLSPIGVAGAGKSVASGEEAPSNEFRLTSDTPALIDYDRGITIAQGRVTLRYGAFTATGKRGVIYNKANPRIAQLSDDLTVVARVRGQEQTFTGQSLSFNLDTGRWDLTDIRATFPADLFPRGQVLEPLFLRDGRVFGTDQDAGGSDFRFSSCDEDHYDLQTREINFYRDENGRPDRIVLRHNALYVFGHKILPLPNFVYSLQGQRSRRSFLQPQVGRNEVDGFFAKTVYDLSANAKKTDSLLIDTLQKRGLGLGLQRELANGAGLFYLYAVSGKGLSSGSNGSQSGREVDAKINRSFNLGRSINSVFSFESSTNNSLTGGGYSNATGSLNLTYAPEAGNASGSLQLSQNNTKNPFSTYAQRQGTLDYTRQLGASWDVSLNTQYNSTQSTDQGIEGGSNSDKQEILDNTFGLGRRGSRFDAALRAEMHDDLTGRTQRNGAYSREKLPELELTSDSQRLGLGALDRLLPANVVLSLGTYNEPETLQRLTRTRFEYNARNRELKLVDRPSLRSRFDLGGGFRQSAYSNNTARYEYETQVAFTTELGRQKEDAEGNPFSALRFLATYQKLKPTGYTPFQFDALLPNEIASATGIFQPSRRAQLEVSGGRDLQNGTTNDLRGTLRLLPTRALLLNVRTSYSLEQKQLNPILADINIVRRRDRFLGGAITIGLGYSPQQSLFQTINVGADLQLGAKTRFVALTSYNGFSKQFDFQQFRIQRDLHCFNLFASYDGQRKQLRFDLALKAFPFVDSRLGQNLLGEGFDPALGAIR